MQIIYLFLCNKLSLWFSRLMYIQTRNLGVLLITIYVFNGTKFLDEKNGAEKVFIRRFKEA